MPQAETKLAVCYSKQYVEKNCLEMAQERISHAFDICDDISVMFSGGKDSTVVLNLALEEARKRGKLPLEVVFFDEECISPDTVDYVRRVSELPDVDFKWLCLPVKHRNGCSRKVPFWYPWDPAKRDLWVRELPDEAITELAGLNGHTIPESNHLFYIPNGRKTGVLFGIRADESITRLRSVTKKAEDNYITYDEADHWIKIKPIYDWTSQDVWLAPHEFGWDYNRTYDLYNQLGIPIQAQRVAPPFGEEPMQLLWMWQKSYPDLWDKMSLRVEGARAGARYSKTEAFGFGRRGCLPGMDWKDMAMMYYSRWGKEGQAIIAERFTQEVALHTKRTKGRAVPMEEPDPISGLSWKFLCQIAQRGDFKGRKQLPKGVNRGT